MVPEAVLPSASESWPVSSLEKDKSLNAGSCSLKAKDFGVSGGLSRGDAVAQSV